MSPSLGAGAWPWPRYWKITVGSPTFRRCDNVQHNPDDQQQYTQHRQRPADQPGGNTPDIWPEGACHAAIGLHSATRLLEEAEDASGEETKAQHEGHETCPYEPSCLCFCRGDFTEKILPLLQNVHWSRPMLLIISARGWSMLNCGDDSPAVVLLPSPGRRARTMVASGSGGRPATYPDDMRWVAVPTASGRSWIEPAFRCLSRRRNPAARTDTVTGTKYDIG